MALKFNNTLITRLFYNGEERQALRVDNIGCFGKQYSLTQNSSSGVTFTVSRTSSPNQQAGTGSINQGNTIYYGDTITISITANSSYSNPLLYVDIGDGRGQIQRTSPFTFVVNNDVIYYGRATINEWETVWIGSETFTSTGSFAVPGMSSGGDIQVSASAEFLISLGQMYGSTDTFTISDSISYANLPANLLANFGLINLSRSGNAILFSFNEHKGYTKGFDYTETPISLTITEVRRQK